VKTNPHLFSPVSSFYLDLIRGIAALIVFFSHFRNLFFLDYPSLSNPNWLTKGFYFATGFGHESVVIFFVLSGAVIGHAVHSSVTSLSWDWGKYLQRRLTRLYIVLVPALVATFAWDHIGMAVFGPGNIYGGDTLGGNVIAWDVGSRSSIAIYLGNLFFLQSIAFPAAGSNGPLWSLSYEFWYYLLFPCVWIGMSHNVTKSKRSFHWIAALLILAFLPMKLSSYFLIWLGGALAAIAHARGGISKNNASMLTLVSGVLCLVALVVIRTTPFMYSDFALGVCFALFLFGLLNCNSDHRELCSTRWVAAVRLLAGMSFSIYVCHLPILTFLRSYFVSGARWNPTFWNLLQSVALASICLAYFYWFAHLTEHRTDRIRRYFEVRRKKQTAVRRAA
jgi:peptidoglycan/LPS O-acetylase OafA/YrhL